MKAYRFTTRIDFNDLRTSATRWRRDVSYRVLADPNIDPAKVAGLGNHRQGSIPEAVSQWGFTPRVLLITTWNAVPADLTLAQVSPGLGSHR